MSETATMRVATNFSQTRAAFPLRWIFAICAAYLLSRLALGTMAFGETARHNATVVAQAYAAAAVPGGRVVCASVSGADPRGGYIGNCNIFARGVVVAQLDCDDDPPAHNDGCMLLRFRAEGIEP